MNTDNCLNNLLKYICLLQNNSNKLCINEGCTKPFLGPNIEVECYNTRVISLYKKDGSLYTLNYDSTNTSSLFRIMNIEGNSLTLLVLSNNDNTYSSTNRYITINTNCICAIRCITDVSINI